MSSPSANAAVRITTKQIEFAKKACAFLTASTDPFHAVANVEKRLKENNFTPLQYNTPFRAAHLQPGGKYYYIVQHTTIVAFSIGLQYKNDGSCGFHIIGGHTDSPNLSVKPNSKKPSKGNTIQLAVQCYGGGLWHTWFDRDLSLSGQVLVRQEDDTIRSQLIQMTDPVARVSTLAIHLESSTERQAFAVNKEEHTSPIVGMINTILDDPTTKNNIENVVSDQINVTTEVKDNTYDDAWKNGQEPVLLQRIAKELQLDNTNQIADFHLNLYDTQVARIGGMNNEFLYSARLDNLATVFTATEAFVERQLENQQDIAMIVFFDHEEVGSESSNGAGSPIVNEAVQRITSALLPTNGSTSTNNGELYSTTIANSFLLSIDMAHALHPNYSSKHESQHAPTINGGLVIKNNSNQRYATNRYNALLVREIGKKLNIPLQEFVVRNDCSCGSTIGPIISTLTGIRTVDAGMPQLSMHSCREVMGIVDLSYGYDLFKGFYAYFREIDSKIDPN